MLLEIRPFGPASRGGRLRTKFSKKPTQKNPEKKIETYKKVVLFMKEAILVLGFIHLVLIHCDWRVRR
jgi:hypothetical protein